MTDDHDHDDGHGHDHDHGWRAELEDMRKEAAHFYADHFDWRGHEPPADFSGPRYFPPAEDWRKEAWLDTDAPGRGDEVKLATSTGKLRDMTVAGQLVFEADGRDHRLTAYASKGDDSLFVPFRDTTAGKETYGAGRYLDVPLPEDADAAIYDLDFNFAYNPSCAYSPVYDCPYPPADNRLDIPIRAGEMVPYQE